MASSTAIHTIDPGTRVMMGEHELVFGETIHELRDCNALVGDVAGLRSRLAEDGYLLIRNFHQTELVAEARMQILQFMNEKGMLHPDYPISEGVVAPGEPGLMFPHDQHHQIPRYLDLVNGPAIMTFFADFLGGETRTLDFKWLRAVATESFTGAHYDSVYMNRGTANLYTCWTPLMDVPLAAGPLAICTGSQHFETVKETYGKMDVDRDKVRGFFSTDPFEITEKFGGQWATTNFAAGDIIIFGMLLMHGSLSNTTANYRISSDTRYQLASEPVDERWVGEKPKAHYAWQEGKGVDMADARREWGIA